MKNIRHIRSILVLCALLAPAAVSAQAVEQSDGSLEIRDNDGRNVMTLHRDRQNRRGFMLDVGGFSINLEGDDCDDKDAQKKNRKAQRYFSLGNLQFGFIGLKSPKYTMYPEGTPEIFDLNTGKSLSVAYDMMVNFPISYRKKHYFKVGLRPRWDNYVLADRYALTRENGMLTPHAVPDDMHKFKKSKLTTFAIDIPVMLKFNIVRRVSVEAGAYGGFVLHQHVKTKNPKNKDSGNFGVNYFQAGGTVRLNIGFLGVFFNYNFTPLFRSGAGPKTQPYSFGFTLF